MNEMGQVPLEMGKGFAGFPGLTNNQEHEIVICVDQYGFVKVEIDGKLIGLISSISFKSSVNSVRPELSIAFANIPEIPEEKRNDSELIERKEYLENKIKEFTKDLSYIPFCQIVEKI